MFQDDFESKPLIKLLIMFVVIILMTSLFVLTCQSLYKAAREANGTTTVISGIVSDKQHIAAHTDTYGFLFSFSSTYSPDEYKLTLKKYDSNKKRWEVASVDVDEDTYKRFQKNDYYTDPSKQTTYFSYENTSDAGS